MLINLFKRSPFAPLSAHMDLVSKCVYLLKNLFRAIDAGDDAKVQQLAKDISKLEHEADLAKNDIRNHLPKTLFLAIDRAALLEILAIQDDIADAAEDIAVTVSLKQLVILPTFKAPFCAFVDKNLEAFEGVKAVIYELQQLIESIFGGAEAEKVRKMVHGIATLEHEADLLQRQLLKALIEAEDELTYTSFYLWQQIIFQLALISNCSEKLANRIRMTLEIK